MIGKRKFAILIIFMISMILIMASFMLIIPNMITADLIQSFLVMYSTVVGAGIGAMGIENLAKYGFGKRTKDEVEP